MKELFTDSNTPVVDSNRILYTASSFARSSLLHLQEIGELHAKKSHTSKRSGLQSYLFFTVLSGSGTLIYNDKGYELRKGSCVFIDCNSPYSHTTDENNLWTLRWIHFYGPTMSNIYQKYCERGGRSVFSLASSGSTDSSNQEQKSENTEKFEATNKLDRISSVWSSLFTTASGADYMRDMLINQHLSTLLTLVMSESWHPEDQEDLPKKRMQLIVVKEWIDENTKIFINPTGRFVVGGPAGDSGLTGRKLIVDTYGGYARHGGGSFSGKDASKVDRTGAYMARYMAKNVVAAGLAERCEVQLSYAIGLAEPMSVRVDTFGTGVTSDAVICAALQSCLDLRPEAIIRRFRLREPIFSRVSCYGHFGSNAADMPWEKTDLSLRIS